MPAVRFPVGTTFDDRYRIGDLLGRGGMADVWRATDLDTGSPVAVLGTAAYLSPEQVRGDGVGTASDVYSLGLVLLEALTGTRAFPGGLAESAVARLNRPPRLPADASPALASLLAAMTALDPAQRPAAAEVAACLRSLAGAMTGDPDATGRIAVIASAPRARPPAPARL